MAHFLITTIGDQRLKPSQASEPMSDLIYSSAKGKRLERYKRHLLSRDYMSRIERDRARVKATAEVFTPDNMVEDMIERVGIEAVCNPSKEIIDPACGDGQFLAYVLWYRLKAGVPLIYALKSLYGIDIMEDNIEMCQERLLCGHKDKRLRRIVDRNIVEANALTYHRRFDGTDPEPDHDEEVQQPGELIALMTGSNPSKV